MSQYIFSTDAPEAKNAPDSGEFPNSGVSLSLPLSTRNNGASSDSSSSSLDEAARTACLTHVHDERGHEELAKAGTNVDSTLSDVRTASNAANDGVGSLHPASALSATPVSSVRANTKLRTQEEFDLSQGALYEPYGLHLIKVLRNRLAPFRDANEKFMCRKLALHTILNLLPIVNIMRHYKWRRELLGDVIGGLTVFALNVPMGMAYGQLSGLGAVYGLYTSTWPLFIYFVLGSSRHSSVGVEATATMLTAGAIGLAASKLPGVAPSAINASMLLLVAIVQLAMGVLFLGQIVVVFFSRAFVTSYTTAVAVHVFSSQVPAILGYKVTNYYGILKLYYFYRDLILAITKFQWISFIISVVCFVLLILTREVIQPRLNKFKWYPNVPLPMPLFLIIIGAVVSNFADLKSHGVLVVGPVPSGLPAPVVPSLSLWPTVWLDAVLLAIICYSITVSLGTIFAAKRGYTIDPNQELIALGSCNLMNAFFKGFVANASAPRSTVQFNAGGTTQCVLASVIIVALKDMIWQLTELSRLWKNSLTDFCVWVVTFVASVVLDVEYGLLVGFGAVAMAIIIRSIFSHSHILGTVKNGIENSQFRGDKYNYTCFVEKAIYPKASEIPGVKVFCFEGALLFASFSYFRSCLIAKTGLDPFRLAKLKRKRAEAQQQHIVLGNSSIVGTTSDPGSSQSTNIRLTGFGLRHDFQLVLVRSPTPEEMPQSSASPIEPKLGRSLEPCCSNNIARVANKLGGAIDGVENSAQLQHFNSRVNSKIALAGVENQIVAREEDSEKGSDRRDVGEFCVNLIETLPEERMEDPAPWPAVVNIGAQTTEGYDGVVESDNSRVSSDQSAENSLWITHLLLDCSGWAYIDDTSLTLLIDLLKEYRAVGVKVWLADCNAGVRAMLKRGNFAERVGDPENSFGSTGLVFPSLKDALDTILQDNACKK